MLPVFRFGLGGKLGSGQQLMSWTSLDDVIAAIDFLVQHEDFEGPVNVVAPNPVTNAEFTRALGRSLHRPAIARVPGYVLRRVLGESADLLLGSCRVFPRRLESAGFRYRYPDIDSALRSALTQT
jgi:hypothetical protein